MHRVELVVRKKLNNEIWVKNLHWAIGHIFWFLKHLQERCCIRECSKIISDPTNKSRCTQCNRPCHLLEDHGALDNKEKPTAIICTTCVVAIREADKIRKQRLNYPVCISSIKKHDENEIDGWVCQVLYFQNQFLLLFLTILKLHCLKSLELQWFWHYSCAKREPRTLDSTKDA